MANLNSSLPQYSGNRVLAPRQLSPADLTWGNDVSTPIRNAGSYWGNQYQSMDTWHPAVQVAASLPLNPIWPSIAMGQMHNYSSKGDLTGAALTALGVVMGPLKQAGNTIKLSKRGTAANAADTMYSPEAN